MSSKLVAYFSASGVTKAVAERLAEIIDADVFEIKPAVPYSRADLDWTNQQSRSSIEMRDINTRPEIAETISNMEDYDIVWIGFPIWLAYHKLIQCTNLREWVHFKFTYKIHGFAPAVGRGLFYGKEKHIFPGVGVMCFK